MEEDAALIRRRGGWYQGQGGPGVRGGIRTWPGIWAALVRTWAHSGDQVLQSKKEELRSTGPEADDLPGLGANPLASVTSN